MGAGNRLAPSFKPIPDSAQRFQIARMAWIDFDFLPQTPHEDVDGARGDE